MIFVQISRALLKTMLENMAEKEPEKDAKKHKKTTVLNFGTGSSSSSSTSSSWRIYLVMRRLLHARACPAPLIPDDLQSGFERSADFEKFECERKVGIVRD